MSISQSAGCGGNAVVPWWKVTMDRDTVLYWNTLDLNAWKYRARSYSGQEPFSQQLEPASMVQLDMSRSSDGWVYITAPESMTGWLSQQLVHGPYYPPVVVAVPSAPNLGEFVLQERSADVAQWFPRWFLCNSNYSDLLGDLQERSRKHLEEYQPDVAALIQSLKFPPASLQNNVEEHSGLESFPGLSTYSELNWAHLPKEEWCRVAVEMNIGEQARWTSYWSPQNIDMSSRFWYHGCPFGAFLGMLQAGGFIPGPNTCTKNSRKVKGAFCTESFWEAFDKGQGHMFDFAVNESTGNKRLNIFCMPVVIEVRPVTCHVAPTRMHGSKHCFEGRSGVVHPGVQVAAVHLNKEVFKNFVIAGHDTTSEVLANPYAARICGQNSSLFRGQVYQGSCGRILRWGRDKIHVSNTGIWYCKACTPFRAGNSQVMSFAIGEVPVEVD
jgi:hypothetical protein